MWVLKMKSLLLALAALLSTGCASVAENNRLDELAVTSEVNGRRWDFARDGEYLYVRASGFQSYNDDMRFKREVVAAAEAYSGCRFTDPVWDSGIVALWAVMGRLECSANETR